jgi:sugar-specific transcriptional regulator TrmB
LADREDSLVEDRLADLQAMGLSHKEAVLYSQLVALGPSSARRVSESARLPREDSYRTLKRLESKGLVEVVLAKPSIFLAMEPRAAVRSFVSGVESRSETLKQRAYDLGVWLETIKGTGGRDDSERVRRESAVRILWGQQVFLELEKSLRSCEEQYEGVLSPEAFVTASGTGILENLLAARKRGVKVRIITEVGPENLETVRRYSKVLAIRRHEGVSQGIRFSVLDRSKIVMALTEPRTSPERATCLCSSVPTLARGLGLYFEQMWKESQEILEPIRRRAKRPVDVN